MCPFRGGRPRPLRRAIRCAGSRSDHEAGIHLPHPCPSRRALRRDLGGRAPGSRIASRGGNHSHRSGDAVLLHSRSGRMGPPVREKPGSLRGAPSSSGSREGPSLAPIHPSGFGHPYVSPSETTLETSPSFSAPLRETFLRTGRRAILLRPCGRTSCGGRSKAALQPRAFSGRMFHEHLTCGRAFAKDPTP